MSRLTVDIEIGSYSRLNEQIDAHNARLKPGQPRLTRTRLMRSLLGSWQSGVLQSLDSWDCGACGKTFLVGHGAKPSNCPHCDVPARSLSPKGAP